MTPFFTITIPYKPIAQQRPRLSRGHTFNPNHDQKIQYSWIFKQAMIQQHKISTIKPLRVELIFSFKKSKTSPKNVTKKPDLDNVAKFYLDAMSNDIVYHDDSAIIELYCTKVYADKPSVNIVIYEV